MADEEDQVDEGTESAEGEDGEEVEGEEGEGKSKKKLLMILVPVILLGGGGAAAYFTGMLDSVLGVEASEEGEHGEGGDDHGEKGGDDHGGDDKHGAKGESAFIEVPVMLVNLKSEDGVPRNFRLKIFLELNNAEDKEKVEAILPRVINEFQIYLRELYVKDLRGSAGIYRLKIELLWRVNQAVEPIEIKDVLFQEILIQ